MSDCNNGYEYLQSQGSNGTCARMGGRAKHKPFGGAFALSEYKKIRRGGKAGGQKVFTPHLQSKFAGPFPRPLSFFARPLFWGAGALPPIVAFKFFVLNSFSLAPCLRQASL